MNQEDEKWVDDQILKRLQPGCLGIVLGGLIAWAFIMSCKIWEIWQRLEAIGK